jgi:hypothetical protein
MSIIMNHHRQRGFSAIEALIIIVILCVVGAGGYLMFARNKDDKNKNTNTNTQQPNTDTAANAPAAKDYTSYINAALGFSFAYPKEWGEITLSAPAAPATGATPDIKDAKKYPFYSGPLHFSVTPKASFQIRGQKYGATYVPVLKNSYNYYIWKVVSVNPADKIDKIGNTYSAPIVNSTAGVQLYDFNWSDEGHNTKRWAFETKAGFVELSLPYFGYADKQPTATDNTIHQSITDTISKSIQLIY